MVDGPAYVGLAAPGPCVSCVGAGRCELACASCCLANGSLLQGGEWSAVLEPVVLGELGFDAFGWFGYVLVLVDPSYPLSL